MAKYLKTFIKIIVMVDRYIKLFHLFSNEYIYICMYLKSNKMLSPLYVCTLLGSSVLNSVKIFS